MTNVRWQPNVFGIIASTVTYNAIVSGYNLAKYNSISVPVRNVTIKDSDKTPLLEGQRRNFICDSGKTKPAAIIWWFLTYQNGSKIRILDSIKNEIKKDQKKFQTISTLELDLKREYGGIMCQAKINDTAWIKSSNLELKIICKYSYPKGYLLNYFLYIYLYILSNKCLGQLWVHNKW